MAHSYLKNMILLLKINSEAHVPMQRSNEKPLSPLRVVRKAISDSPNKKRRRRRWKTSLLFISFAAKQNWRSKIRFQTEYINELFYCIRQVERWNGEELSTDAHRGRTCIG